MLNLTTPPLSPILPLTSITIDPLAGAQSTRLSRDENHRELVASLFEDGEERTKASISLITRPDGHHYFEVVYHG